MSRSCLVCRKWFRGTGPSERDSGKGVSATVGWITRAMTFDFYTPPFYRPAAFKHGLKALLIF